MKMKTIFHALLMALLSIGISNAATTTGWQRAIKVEWVYSPPEDVTVVEYRLYQNGKKVCTFHGGASVLAGECTVTLTKTASVFSLTAAFDGGQESPKSAEYTFTDLGTGPAISKMSAK